MLYHVHEKRYYGGNASSHHHNGGRHHGSGGSHGDFEARSFEALHGLENFQSIGSEQLVHQEFEELHHFAPLARENSSGVNSSQASQSGTRLTTAVKKLSGLVRYVYLSLF